MLVTSDGEVPATDTELYCCYTVCQIQKLNTLVKVRVKNIHKSATETMLG